MKINSYINAIKNKNNSLFSYYLLAFVRVLLVFVPQFGYIHPDEFFQSVEVIAGDEFHLEVTRTWEFNTTAPIRTISVPYIFIKLPLNAIKFFNMYTKYYINLDMRTSYMLLVYPRLIMALLSFVNDYSLYRICLSYRLNYVARLLALSSSYIILVFGTRTFSNSIEMALCSVLLYIVSDCMILSSTVIHQKEFLDQKYNEAKTTVDRVKVYKMIAMLPTHNYKHCFLIATLCVFGVFNRPTFVVFGLPIVFHWLLRGLGTKTVTFTDLNLRMAGLVLSAIPTIVLLIIVDSLYYGFLTMAEIQTNAISINNFVVTPLNNLKYNIDSSKTADHGVHPKYVHMLVNIPLLYNILGVIAVCSFLVMCYRFCAKEYQHLPRVQSFLGLMTSAMFVPVFCLSFINHQEPRFLIPITLPLMLLHGPKLKIPFFVKYPFKRQNFFNNLLFKIVTNINITPKYLLKVWFTLNIILTVFYGFLHQGGVYQLAEHFSNMLPTRSNQIHVHLITSHIYKMPQCFLYQPSTSILHTNPTNGQKYRMSKQFFLYEYGGIELPVLYKKMKLLLDVNEMNYVSKKQKYELYLAVPTSLADDLNYIFYSQHKTNVSLVKYKQITTFYPHLSTEAFPNFATRHPCEINYDLDEMSETCGITDLEEHEEMFSTKYVLKQFSSIVHQFGLTLFKIEVNKKQGKS